VERFHKTLRGELLDHAGPFASMEAAQAAVDGWVAGYNQQRPHQALGMGVPAARFHARGGQQDRADGLGLLVPPGLAGDRDGDGVAAGAVEVDLVVPPSGNAALLGRQLWLGPRLEGQTVRCWVDLRWMHFSLGGRRFKTLPSRYTRAQLAHLAGLPGARAAGPPPADAAVAGSGQAVQVERAVNGCGLVSVGGHQVYVGWALAGQQVRLRLETRVIHVIDGGRLVKTLPSPVPPQQRARVRGARAAVDGLPPRGPVVVERRIHQRGQTMVCGQRLQVGMQHAHKRAMVEVGEHQFRVFVDEVLVATVPRTSGKEVRNLKAAEGWVKTGRG
jgi:hypothetical protein